MAAPRSRNVRKVECIDAAFVDATSAMAYNRSHSSQRDVETGSRSAERGGRKSHMAKARDTSTDRLSNVIEVVELGRRTGMLSAERGSGASFEEGEVFFVSGQAIYAATAYLRGREALAALGQWGACRFAFDTEARRPAPNLAPATAPVGGYPQRGPVSPQRGPASLPGAPSRFGWSTPGAIPAQPQSPPPAPEPGPSSGVWGASTPGSSAGTGPLARRPRRSPDVRDLMAVVSSYNFSRSHRTILLLADGSHNVLDLARLASKSVDEVTQLLAELEARGLIYYYN